MVVGKDTTQRPLPENRTVDITIDLGATVTSYGRLDRELTLRIGNSRVSKGNLSAQEGNRLRPVAASTYDFKETKKMVGQNFSPLVDPYGPRPFWTVGKFWRKCENQTLSQYGHVGTLF